MIAALVGRADAWLREPAPPRRLALLRIMSGAFALVYVTIRAPALARWGDYAPSEFRPTGPVRVLSEPLPSSVTTAIVALTIALGIAFVVGWRYRATGPAFALGLLWIVSYRNSWGMIFHTENLLVLHVLVLGLVPAADVLSIDGRRRPAPHAGPRHGWPVRLMSMLTAATYVVAAVAKLRELGLEWMSGNQLLVHLAHDHVRKTLLGAGASPIGPWLVRNAWVLPPLATFSILAELTAPLALVGPRLARAWCVTALSFHLGVLATMWIFFPYPTLGFAFASLLDVERLEAGARAWLARRRAAR